MKTLLTFAIFIFTANFAYPQNDFNSFEVSGNYLYRRIDKTGDFGFSDKNNAYGFETSVTKNFSRHLGVKFSFSRTSQSGSFGSPLSENLIDAIPQLRSQVVQTTTYTYLGGIQIKDNKKGKKVKPFAHILIGVGTIRQKLTGDDCPNNFCSSQFLSEKGFSAALGGGLDVKVTNRFSIRAIQADYNPIRFKGQISNEFRLGAGIIFH